MSTSGGSSGGGGGFPFISTTLNSQGVGSYGSLNSVNTPSDPVGHTDGPVGLTSSYPSCTVAPSGLVYVFDSAEVDNVDTSTDTYSINVNVTISSVDGTNVLTLQGLATASAGTPGDSASLDSTGMTATAVAGADLTYDDTTGNVTSTAGGVYGSVSDYFGAWD